MPRVSVIIPAFNAEQHIAEALRSVQSQTYGDWEIVLCDDGSTDRTVERARSIGRRVAVVQSTTNLGPAAARNLAIAHASGELLAFLDSDDYWLPSFLERQVFVLDEGQAAYGDVGIVACNASLLEPDGLRGETHMDAVRFPGEVTLDRLLRYNPIYVSVLAPRHVVEEVGGFCTDLSGTADYDLWIRIVEAGYRVLATREPLAVYRIGSPSLSSDARSMARDMQQTYRRALVRGNLPRREQRIARRELRRQDLVERIASVHGLSYRQALRALPLLLLVIAEHPRAWSSLPGMIARGRSALAPFPR
jgi:glycosyltransferase involved in cell wall biosynthesis